MKKYFLGLTAIICALAFSAFTKPFAMFTFKLKTEPIVANIVNDETQWSTTATPLFSRCDDPTQQDIACTVVLSTTTMSTFYHSTGVGSEKIINDATYATPLNADYVEITETLGLSPDRKISTVAFKHFNGSVYVDVTANYSKGAAADYDFVNARD